MKIDRILKSCECTTKETEFNTLLKLYAENFEQYHNTKNENIKKENEFNMKECKKRMIGLL